MQTGIYCDTTTREFYYPIRRGLSYGAAQRNERVKVWKGAGGRTYAEIVVRETDGLEPVGFYGDRLTSIWLSQRTMLDHMTAVAQELAKLQEREEKAWQS
jgi:hypothetical protein